MANRYFMERLVPLYECVVKNALIKMGKHKNKGDWLERSDKTMYRLISGLMIEVGEFIKAIDAEDNEMILFEAGDILNYVAIIIDKLKHEKMAEEVCSEVQKGV